MQTFVEWEREKLHRVYVSDSVKGQVQPADLRWSSQEVGENILEVSEVSDVVVTDSQTAAQVLPL